MTGGGRVVLLLGIQPRSGTNYLHELMGMHPACRVCYPKIKEDSLLARAHLLDDYAWLCGGIWCQSWIGEKEEELAGLRAEIFRGLGRGLERVLGEIAPERPGDILVKTPSFKNLHLLRELFGDAPVVLLCRDGRDVAESMVRSFNRSYLHTFQMWKRSAVLLGAFLADDRGPHHLVRYEDLVAGPRESMERLFAFLGWECAVYPWERIEDVDILGSSEDFSQGWVRARKRPLQSVGRWKSWPAGRGRAFAWLCGGEMKALGYEIGDSRPRWWEYPGLVWMDWLARRRGELGRGIDHLARCWFYWREGRYTTWPVLRMQERRRKRRQGAG